MPFVFGAGTVSDQGYLLKGLKGKREQEIVTKDPSCRAVCRSREAAGEERCEGPHAHRSQAPLFYPRMVPWNAELAVRLLLREYNAAGFAWCEPGGCCGGLSGKSPLRRRREERSENKNAERRHTQGTPFGQVVVTLRL